MAHALSTLQNTSESAAKRRMYVYEYVRTRLMYNVVFSALRLARHVMVLYRKYTVPQQNPRQEKPNSRPFLM